jgi:cell division septation protein DedD
VNTRYETDHDLRDLQNSEEPDREISLGATTILGIFFALALLCAVFFGFGYSQGRRSVPLAAAPTESTMAPESNATKPSSSVINHPALPDKQSAASADTAVVPLNQPSNPPQDDRQIPPPEPARAAVAEPSPVPAKPTTSTPTKQPAPIPTPVATASLGSSVVQVAAMSHQEDADVVALDLKRRGYPVAVRRVPQDKLFHVQIGPYATKKDADAMRQHLQADGYNNAIVK